MLAPHALPSQCFLAALLSEQGHAVNTYTLGAQLNEALPESLKSLPNGGTSTRSFNWKTTKFTCRRLRLEPTSAPHAAASRERRRALSGRHTKLTPTSEVNTTAVVQLLGSAAPLREGETAWDGSFSDDQIQALVRQGAVRADSQHRRQRLLCPPEAPVSSARQALLKPEPVAPDPTAAPRGCRRQDLALVCRVRWAGGGARYAYGDSGRDGAYTAGARARVCVTVSVACAIGRADDLKRALCGRHIHRRNTVVHGHAVRHETGRAGSGRARGARSLAARGTPARAPGEARRGHAPCAPARGPRNITHRRFVQR